MGRGNPTVVTGSRSPSEVHYEEAPSFGPGRDPGRNAASESYKTRIGDSSMTPEEAEKASLVAADARAASADGLDTSKGGVVVVRRDPAKRRYGFFAREAFFTVRKFYKRVVGDTIIEEDGKYLRVQGGFHETDDPEVIKFLDAYVKKNPRMCWDLDAQEALRVESVKQETREFVKTQIAKDQDPAFLDELRVMLNAKDFSSIMKIGEKSSEQSPSAQ